MDMTVLKSDTYNLLQREAPKSLTIQQICSKLDVDDERSVTISLGKLEFEKKVIEDDFQKIFREDGGVILLPRFKVANENDFNQD